MNEHRLVELTQSFVLSIDALRRFKDACVMVIDEEEYETHKLLLKLIPQLTETYLEHHQRYVQQFLDEKEFD